MTQTNAQRLADLLEVNAVSGRMTHTDTELEVSVELRRIDAENAQLRAVICQCLAALKNGSGALPECSLEFLTHAPEEVGAVVAQLRAELEAVRRDTWVPASFRVPLESDGEVFVRFTDGSIGTAWATYWHGASNDFAQWTHPDMDEDRTVQFWMKPPSIDAAQAERAKGGV